jgi:hypothetical protein
MMKIIFITIYGTLIMMKTIFITIYEGQFNKLHVVDAPKYRFMLMPFITGLHYRHHSYFAIQPHLQVKY